MDANHLVVLADRALRALTGHRRGQMAPGLLDSSAKTVSGPLLRVDHAGEVCAQALYLSQSLLARNPRVREAMLRSADEEGEHLRWTSERLAELPAHSSALNPIWFAGSFVVGGVAAVVGDRFSLGFLAETERQVDQHLAGHLRRLPVVDVTSRAVLRQMRADEVAHASSAERGGSAELPSPVRWAMRLTAKVMTVASARI